jgi:phage tail protein X
MATTTYMTKQGDTADEIAWNYYGTRDGLVTEAFLAANKGLAAYGPFLPAGVVLVLPAMVIQPQQDSISLWD